MRRFVRFGVYLTAFLAAWLAVITKTVSVSWIGKRELAVIEPVRAGARAAGDVTWRRVG